MVLVCLCVSTICILCVPGFCIRRCFVHGHDCVWVTFCFLCISTIFFAYGHDCVWVTYFLCVWPVFVWVHDVFVCSWFVFYEHPSFRYAPWWCVHDLCVDSRSCVLSGTCVWPRFLRVSIFCVCPWFVPGVPDHFSYLCPKTVRFRPYYCVCVHLLGPVVARNLTPHCQWKTLTDVHLQKTVVAALWSSPTTPSPKMSHQVVQHLQQTPLACSLWEQGPGDHRRFGRVHPREGQRGNGCRRWFEGLTLVYTTLVCVTLVYRSFGLRYCRWR